jgi:hypothetical protein
LKWSLGDLLPLEFGQRLHVVVKAGNGDASVFIAQMRQHLGQCHRGIIERAAEQS